MLLYDNLCIVSFLFSGVDTRIRFSMEPLGGDDAFQQWRDAMKSVARLPLGIPPEFRKKVNTLHANTQAFPETKIIVAI